MKTILAERYYIKNASNNYYWDFDLMGWQPLGACEPFQSFSEATAYLSANNEHIFQEASFVTIETIYYPI